MPSVSVKTTLRKLLFAYSETASSIFSKLHRSLVIGNLLLILKYYYLCQANFTKFSDDEDSSGRPTSSFLAYLFLFARMKQQSSSVSSTLLYLSLILNGVILAYFLTRVVLKLLQNNAYFYEIKLIHIIYGIYNYAFAVPLFYLSLVFLSSHTFLAILSIALILSNSTISLNGDYNSSYERIDSLQKRHTNGFSLELLFDFIGTAIHYYEDDSNLIIYGYYLVLSLAKAYFHIFFHPYYHEDIAMRNAQLALATAFTSIILLIDDTYATSALISSIPCAFPIARLFFNARMDYLIVKCMESGRSIMKHNKEKAKKRFKFLELDIYCRYLSHNLPCYFVEYSTSKLSPLLEQIIANHHATPHDTLTCFCGAFTELPRKTNGNDQVEREQFLDNQMRQKYLHNYIKQMYLSTIQRELKRSERIEAYFSYFSFLGQIMKHYFAVFLEIQAFRESEQQNNASAMDQVRLQRQISQLNDSFFVHQNAQQSSSEFIKQQNSLIAMVSFDEKLSALEEVFRDCLSKKAALLELLSQPDISLTPLQQALQILFDSRQTLNHLFVEIVSFCCYSSYLRYLCEGFQLCLKPSSQIVNHMKYIKKLQPGISKIPHYEEHSAVAFVSLQPQTFNTINKVSKNFFEVTKTYPNKDAIGKSIDFLLPKSLVNQHNKLVKAYFENESISLKIIEKPKVIGSNGKGWAIPYSLKFQVSYIETMADIGLSVWVKSVQDYRLHIVTDLSPALSVHTLSKELYDNLFKGIVSSSTLNQIQIAKWIPLLSAHEKIYNSCIALRKERGIYSATKEEKVEISFDTLLIKPNEDHLDFQITEEHFFEDFMALDIYGISFDLVFVRNPYMQFLNITINSIEQLTVFEDQQDFILRLKQQVIDFDIQFNKLPAPIVLGYYSSSKMFKSQAGSSYKSKMKDLTASFHDGMGFENIDENYEEEVEEEDMYLGDDYGQRNYDKELSIANDLIANHIAPPPASSSRGLSSSRFFIGSPLSFQQTIRPTSSAKDLFTNSVSPKLIKNNSQENQQNDSQLLIQKQLLENGGQNNSILQFDESMNQQQQRSGYVDLQKINQEYFKSPTQQPKHDNFLMNTSVNNSLSQTLLQQSTRSKSLMRSSKDLTKNTVSTRMKKYTIFQKAVQDNNNNNNDNLHNNIDGKAQISNSYDKAGRDSKSKSSETITHKQIKQNNKQSTAASGMTSEKSDRYKLARFISRSNGLTGIQIINWMGGLSMLGIAIVSVVSYVDNYSTLINDQENFQYVNWLCSVSAAVTIVNTDLSIKRNTEIGFFVLSAQNKADLLAALLVDMIEYDEIMRDLLNQLGMPNSQNMIMFNSLVGLSATEELYNGSDPIQVVPTTFIYKIITQAAYLTMQARQWDSDMVFQHNAELNFDLFVSLVHSTLDTIVENFQEQSDSQEKNALFWLFVFGGISLLFSLSVIPTYTFIINKQQQILYLFATFEPEKISFMERNIVNCRLLLSGTEKMKESLRSQENLKTKIKKKKNISNTHPLTPSYFRLTIIVAMFFVFLQLQPLTDYLLSASFLSACANRLQLIVKVMNMQEMINVIIQVRQEYMIARFNTIYVPLDTPYYLEFVRTSSIRSVTVFNDFFQIIGDKDKYKTYETDLMENFFYQAVEVNACSTIDKYPQYRDGISFVKATCESSNKGVLKSGISVAMNDFVTGYVTFYQQALGSDDALFLTEVNSFFTNMKDRFYAKKYMTNSLEFLIIFLKIINYEQYANQIVVSQILIAWQLIAIFIAFFFGFTRYSQYIQKQVQQTKEFIGLIEIPVLIYNPYILSYLKKVQ